DHYAPAAENLHASIYDPEAGIDAVSLDHGGMQSGRQRGVATVHHPCGMISIEANRLNVEFVVGEHELYRLIIDERLAEDHPVPGIIERDFVAALRHTECEPAQAKPEPVELDLCNFEAETLTAQKIFCRHDYITQFQLLFVA